MESNNREKAFRVETARLRYRSTTARLKARRGSEQYHSTNSVIAWSYVRWPLFEVRVLRTADFACSRSGKARTRFGDFFFLRDFDIRDGLLNRRRQRSSYPAVHDSDKSVRTESSPDGLRDGKMALWQSSQPQQSRFWRTVLRSSKESSGFIPIGCPVHLASRTCLFKTHSIIWRVVVVGRILDRVSADHSRSSH